MELTAPARPMSRSNLGAFRIVEPKLTDAIAKLYVENEYGPSQSAYVNSPAGQSDVHAVVTVRYEQSLLNMLPWIDRVFDLRGKDVLEIGCGAGSSTQALALVAGRIFACDPKACRLPVARGRLDLLGFKNVTIVEAGAPAVFERAQREFAPQVDAIVLSAVVEHQTIHERIESLKLAWSYLREGGVLVVTETPNRLAYNERHTADLPFYFMLGLDLAVRYADRSPRDSYRTPLLRVRETSFNDAMVFLARMGIGASHHEFELGLPKDGVVFLADGYEPEITALWGGVNYSERLLQSFVLRHGLDLHPAFMRHTLSFIVQKDSSVVGWASKSPTRTFGDLVADRPAVERVRDLVAGGQRGKAMELLDALLADRSR